MNQLRQSFLGRFVTTLAIAFAMACSSGQKDSPRPSAVHDAGEHTPEEAGHSAADTDADGGSDGKNRPSAPDHDQQPDHSNKADAGESRDAAVKPMDAGDPRTDDDDAGDTHARRCRIGAQHTVAGVPTIWLVLDGSGSLTDMLGDTSRWQTLKGALLDPSTGVVKSLEHDVKWGLWMFDGPGGNAALPDGGMFSTPPATTCPRVVSVQPKLDNFADIAASFPTDPLGGSTPTDKALDKLLEQLPASSASDGTTSVVFATDGAPNNLCDGGNPFEDIRPLVLAEVQKLTDRNIKTYVISLAGEDQMLMQHVADVAKTGATGKAPFVPQNTAELRSVLQSIAVRDPACELRLATSVTLVQRCDLSVKLGGDALACDAADGFSVDAPSTLRLSGSACQRYTADPSSLQVDGACPQP